MINRTASLSTDLHGLRVVTPRALFSPPARVDAIDLFIALTERGISLQIWMREGLAFESAALWLDRQSVA